MSNLPAVASAVGERGIELGRLNTNAASDVQDLFQQIKEFEMLLDNTAVMVHRLKEANREFRSVTEASAVKAIKEHMERNMDEVWKMAHTMTDKLKKMILDSFENKNNAWSEIHGRVTMPMAPSSMTTLIALKNDLQNLRNTIREEYQEVVQIRIFAVSGTKLSDEVIRVIEVGSIVQILENAHQGTIEIIAATVEEIEERHAAVLNFDKKLIESHQIFAGLEERIVAQEKAHKAVSRAVKKVRRIETRLQDVETRLRDADEELRAEMKDNKALLFTLVAVLSLFLLFGLWLFVAAK